MGRILAVDYGKRRIGLAVSDGLGLTAQGLPTVEALGPVQAVKVVHEAVVSCEAEQVVVGLPLNMDGSRGPMAEAAEAFAAALREATGVPVTCWDERLTSVAAHRAMQEMGQKIRGRKGMVDRIAATLLLEAFLQTRSE